MGYGVRFRVWGDYACFTRPEMKTERVTYDVITPSAARGILECIYWKPAIRWVIDKITVMNPIVFGNIKLNEVKQKAKMPSGELSKIDGDSLTLYTTAESDNRAQRGMMYLKNPEYVIEAHFESTNFGADTNDSEKHYAMMMRRLRAGQCFKQPCLGMRNFSAKFEIVEDGKEIISQLANQEAGNRDLGWMLYDMKFRRTIDGIDKGKESAVSMHSEGVQDDWNVEWRNLKAKFVNDAVPEFFRAIMVDGVIDVAACREKSGVRQ